MVAHEIADFKKSTLDESRLNSPLTVEHLTATNATNDWHGGVGSQIVANGKFYFEAICTVSAPGGLCRVGWSKRTTRFELGMDEVSLGYGGTGTKLHNKTYRPYGTDFKVPNVTNTISCYYDSVAGIFAFATNGINEGPAFTRSSREIRPSLKMFDSPLYPAFFMKNASMTLNFGTEPFLYDVDIFKGSQRPQSTGTLPSVSDTGASEYRNSTLISCRTRRDDKVIVDDIIIVDLTATNDRTEWHGGIGSESVSCGRAYFEATCRTDNADDGFCRVGWSQQTEGFVLGENARSVGYGGAGAFKYHDTDLKKPALYGRQFGDHDVIGCYLDYDNGTVMFSTNNEYEGIAYSKDDFTSTLEMFENPLYPAFCLHDASITMNFGATPFLHYDESRFEEGNQGKNVDKYGHTKLHRAANDWDCKYTVVYHMIQDGADVTVRNKDGRTALHVAVARRQFEIANILYTFGGSDIFAVDRKGASPLILLGRASTRPKCPHRNAWLGRINMDTELIESIIKDVRWPFKRTFPVFTSVEFVLKIYSFL